MDFPTISTQGYFVQLTCFPTTVGNHRFCGEHDIVGAQCPNCQLPLLRFLSLELANSPVQLGSTMPYAHLLYCWRCNLAQRGFSYCIVAKKEIAILAYGAGKEADDFPYEDYPNYFPGTYIDLMPLSNEEQEIIVKKMNDEINIYTYKNGKYEFLTKPQHQIGGVPLLMQSNWEDWIFERCPICNQTMIFFASIGDFCLDVRGFTMNPYVQVIYLSCSHCNVFKAFAMTD